MAFPACVDQHALVDAYPDTERLTLRPFTIDDAELLIELDSDPAVMRLRRAEWGKGHAAEGSEHGGVRCEITREQWEDPHGAGR